MLVGEAQREKFGAGTRRFAYGPPVGPGDENDRRAPFVAEFPDGGLEALGGNLYRESVASGEPVEGVAGEEGLGQLKQGVLEGSNVQVVEAMVNMIAIQRAYEANAKVLDAASGMQQFLNQTV